MYMSQRELETLMIRRGGRLSSLVLPHPRSPGGKPQRLTARVKIASAPVFPTRHRASFCQRPAGPISLMSVCVCVCHARATSQIWEHTSARFAPSNDGIPNFSTGR